MGRAIVIGTSAGGVEALSTLVGTLPAAMPAPVLVVMHVPRGSTSSLPAILSRAGRWPAAHAVDGESPLPGRVYIAPSDQHLLVINGRLRLSDAPPEHGHRPSIDSLFRSAARCWGSEVIGVILSGASDDGALGLAEIDAHGGAAIVQDPRDAMYASMPRAATVAVPAATIRAVSEMATALAELTVLGRGPAPVDPVPVDRGSVDRDSVPAPAELSAAELADERRLAMHAALQMAMQALTDKAAISAKLADGGEARGNAHTARRYRNQVADLSAAIELLRDLARRLDRSDF